MARRAHSLATLLRQLNEIAPNRDKKSDGWIGDAAHASRASDHNPNAAGVVCAHDYTHDPAHGLDSYRLAEVLRQRKDPRINYVISNGQIFSSSVNPWVWRRYTGSNPHAHHMHVSVKQQQKLYDDAREWDIKPAEGRPWDEGKMNEPTHDDKAYPLLKRNSKDKSNVLFLQTFLGVTGRDLDGLFGPKTEALVKQFQKANKLTVDGIVGPQTWEALMKTRPSAKPV